MSGIGRAMPLTMTAFGLGALCVIGTPPFGGSWSKWYLALGALEAHQPLFVGVLVISSLLNIAYLMPVVARAFFAPPSCPGAYRGISEAPILCLAPLCLTAVACLALFFYADAIYHLLTPIALP